MQLPDGDKFLNANGAVQLFCGGNFSQGVQYPYIADYAIHFIMTEQCRKITTVTVLGTNTARSTIANAHIKASVKWFS